LPKMILTSGLKFLYEGKTISYAPNLSPQSPLKHIAKSSGGNSIILFSDFLEKNQSCRLGRVVVDTGFTKLWTEWTSLGTERFVCNATVWLLGLEYRMNNQLPLRGPLFPIEKVPLFGKWSTCGT